MIRNLRAIRLRTEVDKRERLYAQAMTLDGRLSAQLALFNQCWSRIRLNVAFYRELARNANLLETFRSWKKVLDRFRWFFQRLAGKNGLANWGPPSDKMQDDI